MGPPALRRRRSRASPRCRPRAALSLCAVTLAAVAGVHCFSAAVSGLRPGRGQSSPCSRDPRPGAVAGWGAPTVRPAQAGRRATEGATPTKAEEVSASESGTSIVVIQGASRYQLSWSPDDTAAAFRKRVEVETGVPPEKQLLQLASQQVLDETCEGLLEAVSSGGRSVKVWLTDERTPEEIRAAMPEGADDEVPVEEFWTPARIIVTFVITFAAGELVLSGKPLVEFLLSGGAPIKPQ